MVWREEKEGRKKSFLGGEVVPGLGGGELVAAGPPGPAVVPVTPLPAVPPPLSAVSPPAPAVSPRPPPWAAGAPSPLAAGEGPIALPVRAEEPTPDVGGGRLLPGGTTGEAGDGPLSLPAVVSPALPLLTP